MKELCTMTRIHRIAASTITVLATLTGCAATSDESISETGTSQDELTSLPASAAECNALLAKNPITETRTLSTGDVVPIPLRTCDSNLAAIFGTIDLAFAQQVLAGTGYEPLEVVRPGQPNAGLARLYFVDYLHNDLGPYRAFFLLVDAAEKSATLDAKRLTWVNPLSSLLPAFDPQNRTIIVQMILPKEAKKSIAYGRELMGIDKRAGAVDYTIAPNAKKFAVTDENGKSVVHGSLHPDMSLFTLAGTVAEIAGAAIGEQVTSQDISFKLHPLTLNRPVEVTGQAIARIGTGKLVRQTSSIHYLPSINDASPRHLDLHVDGSSELGKRLNDAHFTPAAFLTADHAKGVWTIHD